MTNSFLPLPVYAPFFYATFRFGTNKIMPLSFIPLSFMPLSGLKQNELYLFPLCRFPFQPLSVSAPFRLFSYPDWWKMQIMPDSFMPTSAPPFSAFFEAEEIAVIVRRPFLNLFF
jgi:hypothetical protein